MANNANISRSSGYSGFSGYSGYSGFSGLSGYSGFSGSPGQVTGPGSSTDDAIATWSGTGGNIIQNTTVTVDDAGVVSGNSFIGDVFDVNYVIDGGGSVIASGSAGGIEIPWNATPLSWNMFAGTSGTISVDVRRSTYAGWSGDLDSSSSIVGTEKPTITTGFKNQDTSLTSWSGISSGDFLNFHVDATPTGIFTVTLAIKMRKFS